MIRTTPEKVLLLPSVEKYNKKKGKKSKKRKEMKKLIVFFFFYIFFVCFSFLFPYSPILHNFCTSSQEKNRKGKSKKGLTGSDVRNIRNGRQQSFLKKVLELPARLSFLFFCTRTSLKKVATLASSQKREREREADNQKKKKKKKIVRKEIRREEV